MRKLPYKHGAVDLRSQHIHLEGMLESRSQEQFVQEAKECLINYNKEFYEVIGILLRAIGFTRVLVTRDGDTNNRVDAIIVDDVRTIPVEIKSPGETMYMNIKSVRQALENKIILLSRGFYPTTPGVTSLAVGFDYPKDRSGVYELVEDIWDTFGIRIGLVGVESLLSYFYDVKVNNEVVDLEAIFYLKGRVDA